MHGLSTPASSPRPDPALRDLFAAEARREFRGDLIRVSVLALLAFGIACLIPFARTMQLSGPMEVVPGTLVDIRRYKNEKREVGVYAFVDHVGRARETTSSMEPGEFAIGDIVYVIYSLEDEDFSRPVNASERYMREAFIGLTIVQSLLAALAFAWFWRRYRERLRLVREGVARQGGAARIVERQVPIAGIPRQWRLCVPHFDEPTMRWRDVVSSWRDAPVPILDESTAVPPTLFDPRDARRRWQPLGWLAPEARR
jgi:hypothetical protein